MVDLWHRAVKALGEAGEVAATQEDPTSNRAYLDRAMYKGTLGEFSWGWRMGGDEFRSHHDGWEENEIPELPLELLAKAASEATREEYSFFRELLRSGKGIEIGDSWYLPEQIAPVLQAALQGKE